MALTATQVPKTISKGNNKLLAIHRYGFTLIEILVVLAIISLVMSLGLPAISRVTAQQLNSTTRRFVGIIRTIRNDSILLNTVHRLAIDMDRKQWWVEAQRQFQLIEEQPIESKKKKGGKKDEEAPSNFTLAEKFSKKPVEMPGGVEFQGVLKEREGFYKGGVAYVHFFPNGFNDHAILYLNREGAEDGGYSLLIRPTSGRVEIFYDKIKDFD